MLNFQRIKDCFRGPSSIKGKEVRNDESDVSKQDKTVPHQSKIRRALRFLLYASPFFLGGSGTAIYTGIQIADYAVQAGQQKQAIPLIASSEQGADSTYETIGWLYGPYADPEGLHRDYYGMNAAPIDPNTLKIGGELREFYLALIALEDHGHEGGDSDLLGVSLRGIYSGLTGGVGTSSIADQTSGSLLSGSELYRKYGISETSKDAWQAKITRKVIDSLSALGLAIYGRYSPEEIVALYGTHGYFAPRVRGIELCTQGYFGLENGIYDKNFTIAHQLLLAAMAKYPYNGHNLDLIRARAIAALNMLTGNNQIPSGQRSKILAQFDNITIHDPAQVNITSLLKNPDFFPVISQVIQETSATFSGDWTGNIEAIHLNISPTLQTTAAKSCQRQLKVMGIDDPALTCIAMAVTHPDESIRAVYVGNTKGPMTSSRLEHPYSAASLGKIFIAGAAERKFPDLHDKIGISSTPGVIWSARAHGIDRRRVDQLTQCFSNTRPNVPSFASIRTAATGNTEISPLQVSDLVYTMTTGVEILHSKPQVVAYFINTQGDRISPQGSYSSTTAYNPDSQFLPDTYRYIQECSGMIDPMLMRYYLHAPFEGGTLGAYASLGKEGKIWGKTGTAGSPTGENSATWTVMTTPIDSNFIAGADYVTTVALTGYDSPGKTSPFLPISTHSAAPIAGKMLQTVRDIEQGKKPPPPTPSTPSIAKKRRTPLKKQPVVAILPPKITLPSTVILLTEPLSVDPEPPVLSAIAPLPAAVSIPVSVPLEAMSIPATASLPVTASDAKNTPISE